MIWILAYPQAVARVGNWSESPPRPFIARPSFSARAAFPNEAESLGRACGQAIWIPRTRKGSHATREHMSLQHRRFQCQCVVPAGDGPAGDRPKAADPANGGEGQEHDARAGPPQAAAAGREPARQRCRRLIPTLTHAATPT